MTVKELAEKNNFRVLSLPDGAREVTGVYIGDLLSWVMGRAESGDAWITIMSNINILAVASLADTACIVLAEDVSLSDDILETAKEKRVNILSCAQGSYEAAVLLSQCL